MPKFIRPLAALACALAAHGALAHGSVECPIEPREQWRPQMELQRTLVDQGWRVRQVKLQGSCYEVYGFDAKGTRVEAFFNPRTFERIWPKGTQPDTPPAAAPAK